MGNHFLLIIWPVICYRVWYFFLCFPVSVVDFDAFIRASDVLTYGWKNESLKTLHHTHSGDFSNWGGIFIFAVHMCPGLCASLTF